MNTEHNLCNIREEYSNNVFTLLTFTFILLFLLQFVTMTLVLLVLFLVLVNFLTIEGEPLYQLNSSMPQEYFLRQQLIHSGCWPLNNFPEQFPILDPSSLPLNVTIFSYLEVIASVDDKAQTLVNPFCSPFHCTLFFVSFQHGSYWKFCFFLADCMCQLEQPFRIFQCEDSHCQLQRNVETTNHALQLSNKLLSKS